MLELVSGCWSLANDYHSLEERLTFDIERDRAVETEDWRDT